MNGVKSKICFKCKEEKPLELFHVDRKTETGRASYCKECAKKHSKRWYETSEKYRQIVRDSGLRHRFGITSTEYFQMLEDQNGLCAICEKTNGGQNFHVDHCHGTGKIRGLLCKPCNLGLGNFRDNVNYLKNAIEYLT